MAATLDYRMYATNPQLRRLFSEYRDTGRMPDELLSILEKVVTGVAGRFRYWRDLDDRKQDFFLQVLRKAGNVRLDGNIFGWLTTVAANVLRQHQRRRVWQLVTDTEGDAVVLE